MHPSGHVLVPREAVSIFLLAPRGEDTLHVEMNPVEHATNCILQPPLSETFHLAWLNREYSKLMRRELNVAAREARLRRPPAGTLPVQAPCPPSVVASNIPESPRWGDADET